MRNKLVDWAGHTVAGCALIAPMLIGVWYLG